VKEGEDFVDLKKLRDEKLKNKGSSIIKN